MPRHCYDTARHVLVTTWDCYTSVVVLGTCDSLDAICDDLARLKRKPHPWSDISRESPYFESRLKDLRHPW